jgi:Oxidoreductase molybdopterin binding domain
LAEAGVGRDKIDSVSEQLVGQSVDGWTAGFRTDKVPDGREALVAFGLNGGELPLEHGYPVRLVVPGLYGYVSATKWLTEIELTDWDFDAYWIQRNWSKEGPILTQSRIDTVKNKETLSAGAVDIGGAAWAPHRGIDASRCQPTTAKPGTMPNSPPSLASTPGANTSTTGKHSLASILSRSVLPTVVEKPRQRPKPLPIRPAPPATTL